MGRTIMIMNDTARCKNKNVWDNDKYCNVKTKDGVSVGNKPPNRVSMECNLSKPDPVAASPLDPRVEARMTRGMLSELHLII